MDRNLALEMVRVTEAAALSSARMMGRGDRKAADQACPGTKFEMQSGVIIADCPADAW
mgnify:CR=1 FL=1